MVTEAGFSEQTAATVCLCDRGYCTSLSLVTGTACFITTDLGICHVSLALFFLLLCVALYQICPKPWLNFRSSHESNFPFSLVSFCCSWHNFIELLSQRREVCITDTLKLIVYLDYLWRMCVFCDLIPCSVVERHIGGTCVHCLQGRSRFLQSNGDSLIRLHDSSHHIHCSYCLRSHKLCGVKCWFVILNLKLQLIFSICMTPKCYLGSSCAVHYICRTVF